MPEAKPGVRSEVKVVPGPRIQTMEEMSIGTVIRELVEATMETTPGSTNKKIETIVKEIDRRLERKKKEETK